MEEEEARGNKSKKQSQDSTSSSESDVKLSGSASEPDEAVENVSDQESDDGKEWGKKVDDNL